MTKSQKKILSRIKKEIKNFFSTPEELRKVYAFLNQVEQIIVTEELEYKERKRKKEKEIFLSQLSFDDFLEYMSEQNSETNLQQQQNTEESGDSKWEEH